MGGRGLSAEEKRVKLLEIFHETKDFFQLKELEKLGPKLKGIVSQSVKEVLQSLVDDGMVQMDKIGASNFFWSFPSQHGAMMSAKLSRAKDSHHVLQQQLSDLRGSVLSESAHRVPSQGRDEALHRMDHAKRTISDLTQELAQYGACDPVQVEEKKRAVVLAHEASIRWTDNFSIIVSHFTKQSGIEADVIRKHFNLPETYEDIF